MTQAQLPAYSTALPVDDYSDVSFELLVVFEPEFVSDLILVLSAYRSVSQTCLCALSVGKICHSGQSALHLHVHYKPEGQFGL